MGTMQGFATTDPRPVARSVRTIFEHSIPTTYEQLRFARGYHLSAFTAACIVREQTGCEFRAAADAVAEEIPELTAEYWASL